jgi:hypothetical protein
LTDSVSHASRAKLPGALLLKGVELIPKHNIFHGMLTNPAVFFLQLAGSIFYRSEFARLDSGSIGQGLYVRKRRSEHQILVGKVRYHQYRILTVENLYNSLKVF